MAVRITENGSMEELMKRNLMILTILAIAASGVVVAGDGTVYGDGVTLDKAIPIETVLAKPGDYVGKKVRVDGIITGVCKNRGCWMQVSDENGNGLRIKVEDGVIVFPATSTGHRASAEGVFEAIPVQAEQADHDAKGEESHSGCAKSKAAQNAAVSSAVSSAVKPGCAKSKAAKAEGSSDCAKNKAATETGDAGCDAKAQGKFVYLVRGTGAVIYS